MITAVHVDHGAYVDGTQFPELMKRTQKCGVTIEEFLADKAYFKKPILDDIKEIGAKPYIPVSPMAYRIDEEKFSYRILFLMNGFAFKAIKRKLKNTTKINVKKNIINIILKRKNVEIVHWVENCVSGTRVGRVLADGYGYSRVLWIQSRTKD